ncbi:MAG TPA: tRNA glutamyl-Q(34) synthetase GluQRS [Spongiibacteraceae bacterium]
MAQSRSSHFPAHYVGRFAPSPTGPLHFGSLLAALASFLDARANNGQWLVRIEDIDPPRETPGAATAILRCLQAHALMWDGDVLYQSTRTEIYRQACAQLLEQRRAFYCTCSRLDLANNNGVYSGRCRHCLERPRQLCTIRLCTDALDIHFDDAIQASFTVNMARDIGDFVIYRKENLPAYQLAVAIDDAAQNITHIVRGFDLLDSTPRQIFLQHCLHLPTPHYAHIPVIANSQRQKLSKQTFARALNNANAVDNLLAALEFLRQPLPPKPHTKSATNVLDWAIAHWDMALIPRRDELYGDALPPRCRHFAT